MKALSDEGFPYYNLLTDAAHQSLRFIVAHRCAARILKSLSADGADSKFRSFALRRSLKATLYSSDTACVRVSDAMSPRQACLNTVDTVQ